jgi:hypothetical protein
MEASNAAKPAPDLPGNGPRNIDSLAALDVSNLKEITGNSQAQIERSPAVAAAIQRVRARKLAIKRGSIASLGNMAGANLDGTMEALENVDNDVMLERGARFIENARAFKKLLADFRDAREANQ